MINNQKKIVLVLFIHERNIQCLATAMYKVSKRLPPPVVSNIFRQKIATLTICDLILSFPDLLVGLHSTKTISYLGPVI